MLLATPLLWAQEAPAPAAEPEETIVLSPFEVTAEQDNGYAATQTLAGTRIRTDLADVGAAISVVTKEFLKDVGATGNSTLLQYTTNAEVAGARGTYVGLGNGTDVNEAPQLRAPSSAQRVRGLAAADNTRDFFVTDIPWDSFNVDRVDIQRGPNAILFGLGSPAGIVNAQTRNAEFRNTGSFEGRVGGYGSWRTAVDINQVLIPKVLSIRLDGLWNDEKYRQEPAYQQDKRVYGALRFDPQLFGRNFFTSIRAKFEHGEIEANRPRITPPNDSITPWFRAADTTSLNGGAGKAPAPNGYVVGPSVSSYNPWFASDSIANQQQPIWFIDGTTNQLQRIYGGFVSTGPRNPDGSVLSSTSNLVGQRYSSQFFGLTNLASYATIAGLPGAQYGQYRTASLLDPTVFDFYNKLIDGPTKSEFEKWNTHNITLTQTGWDDRVGFDFNYDRQIYARGGEGLIFNQPTLNIDILQAFQDLNANPNYGRPYVVGGPGGGTSYESDRKYLRASVFGEARATDFFAPDSFLAKLLGKHRFNGAYSSEKFFREDRGWRQYLHSLAWDNYWTRNNPTEARPPVGIVYLGSSLANAASAAGSNIPGITAPVTLPDGNVYHFASTWTNFAVPFNAPWTVPDNLLPMLNTTATPAPNTQASNPANYVGWNSNLPITLRRYNHGEDLTLLTSARKTQRETSSLAGSWQGFWWKDAVVTTLGWRYDEVKTKRVVAPSLGYNAINLQPDVYRLPAAYDPSQIFKDHSASGGVVVHVNKLLGERLSLPINVSLTYNKSSNFQVEDARRDIFGNTIGNPTGNTKDYGVLLSTKDGKYTFRALKYESNVANTTTQLNSRGLTDTIAQGLNWRNIVLYRMEGYTWDGGRDRNLSASNVNVRHDWLPVYVNAAGRAVFPQNPPAGRTPPEGSTLQTAEQGVAMRDATIRAWNDIQKWLDAKGYFQAWGYAAGPATLSALTDRATYEATLPRDANGNILPDSSPAAQYTPVAASIYDYRKAPKPDLQGFAVTADTQSKGYEFEFTANPTNNWRISINASKSEAVRTNVGGALLDELVKYMADAFAGAAGDLRMFNARFDNPANVMWNNSGTNSWLDFRGQYMLFKLNEGAAASELRKWRYNVVTNYTFSDGFMKGVGVGGSYRWQDKVVLGYPVTAIDANNFTFDLSKPYYGPTEDAVDLWMSYERKLTKKIDWKIQLNIRNAFAEDGLIPVSVQPDGKTWATVRVKPTQEWFITNTFSF